MKLLIVTMLFLGCGLRAEAENWQSQLRQWRGQLASVSGEEQTTQQKAVRLAKHRLLSIRPEKAILMPQVSASEGNLHSQLHLTDGLPGDKFCRKIKAQFTNTNKNMKLLREWVEYLDRLLEDHQRCQTKADHALDQIDQLVQLISDGYPSSYDETKIVGNFHWNVVLPGNTQSIGRYTTRRSHWNINFVHLESIKLSGLVWPADESPIAITVSHKNHSIDFSLPLSLTQACVGNVFPTIKGAIMATSTYKHNFPTDTLRELPKSTGSPKEFSFEVVLTGPQQ